MPMRVLHWYPSFQRGGGVANIVLHLADAQAELGMEPMIASAEAVGMYGTPTPGAGVELIAWRPTWQIGHGGIVLRGIPHATTTRLRALRPDVVHVHGEFNPDNWWVPRLFDAPIVLSPHGAFHPSVFEKSARRGKAAYVKAARRLLYRHASLVHAVSPMEERHLSVAFPKTEVYCAPQGTSIPFDGLASTGVSAPTRENGAVQLLFVGRLDVYTKGLDLLVDAYAAALRARPSAPLQLTLVGPDWKGGRADVEARARRAGVGDRIRLTGAVSSAELAQLLPTFDCYVQLSRHESFGFGVADALAVGKPVIMTSSMGIASFPELAGLPHVRVVEPETGAATAAIVAVAAELESLRVDAVAARAPVRQLLSWQRIAGIHRERYEQLAPRRPHAEVTP